MSMSDSPDSRGPAMLLWCSEDQRQAVAEALPAPYTRYALDLLLAHAGRWDLIDPGREPWVREAMARLRGD